ncbi:hypothetical protein R1flu_017397 [Riccia fluitans]|uniref:DEUBAD domain-containing protein n=1 Tax=Riccia fluitans TaxID=41844 RepID=A0ABD1ZG86_9MARC
MAITGSASKTGKAGGTHSVSSTDEDVPPAKKSKPPQQYTGESDVSADAEVVEKGTELCQLGDETCAVPIELFNLSDLKSVLSLETWNFALTDEEREYLVSFLPAMGEEDFRTTMQGLLGGDNFHFGSPLAALFDRLKSGLCTPKVARYNESLKYVQRKKHYHLLRNYHNQMVNSFLDMQKAWEDCPESADVEERLEMWNSWKSEKLTPPVEQQVTPVHKKKSESVKKLKLTPVVSKKIELPPPEERRAEIIPPLPAPVPVNTAPPRGGSKGVLKMKVIAPKAEQGGKSLPEREPERVQVPAPKGVLKVASKGVQGYAKADAAAAVREKALMAEPKREPVVREMKAAKVVKALKPVKDVELADHQISRSTVKPVSEKRKQSLGGDRKSKKPVDDQEIFVTNQSEPHTRYSTETPSHEVQARRRTPPSDSRKNVKSYPRTFYSAYEEARGHEDEKNLEYERKLAKKKRKKPAEEQKKVVMEIPDEEEYYQHVDDRRMQSDSRQDEYYNGREHMEFKEEEAQRVTKKKSKKKTKELKREPSPRETTPEDSPGERVASVKSSKQLLSVSSIASTFSFSIRHLLSAVRAALTRPCGDVITDNQNGALDGAFDYGKVFLSQCCDLSSEHGDESPSLFGDGVLHLIDDIDDAECQRNPVLSGVFEDEVLNFTGVLPDIDEERRSRGISFGEIVTRVQNNPGDPRILENDEPLSNLVSGTLKVFSSKIAPPGAKGWKPLADFDRVSRTWSWIGPRLLVSSFDSPHEVLVTAEAWGVPQRMLTKLEDAFATWLKHGQETRKLIIQLPSPPAPPALLSLDEKERFRDLKAQKSLMTIAGSSDDMKAYFQREEVLRYTLPDRPFSYTTADGRKSVVSPLRRGGGKPTSKARDHFMLKPDRPPHVTILCLVRDAAARLPGSIGTRADVCTLIRDSQYIVDDVSDLQINQVVSGALDRLHYERDPCVRFDGDRKLWMYLHTERQEEDFDDDGTYSTKRWKKPRKGSGDGSHLRLSGFVNGSPSGAESCEINSSDEIGEPSNPSAIYSVGRTELVYCKSSSLSSPRVLNVAGNSTREECSLPFTELVSPPNPSYVDSLNTHASAWGTVGSTTEWVSDHGHLSLHESFGQEDYGREAAGAAQRDADVMR